ncbi:MAG TPA: hypothetical protein VD833_24425 [Vicinamibacterales bacterium]|nr:hypothetical protein [Vicinamibacterales bacterium]
MTDTVYRDFDLLEKAGLVVLALQVAIFAALAVTAGFDRASDGYPILVLSTALFVAGQRRLAVRPPNRGAAQWIFASRALQAKWDLSHAMRSRRQRPRVRARPRTA